jgi:hypothetical protein
MYKVQPHNPPDKEEEESSSGKKKKRERNRRQKTTPSGGSKRIMVDALGQTNGMNSGSENQDCQSDTERNI